MSTAEVCGTCRHLVHRQAPYIDKYHSHYYWCERRKEQRCYHDAACQYHERGGEYPLGGPPAGSRQIDDEWRQERSVLGARRDDE